MAKKLASTSPPTPAPGRRAAGGTRTSPTRRCTRAARSPSRRRSRRRPLIDIVAPDVADLLRQLDGRTVTRFDGTTTVLHTAGARVVPVEMNWRQRVLSALAHPSIAYLLLSLGMLGLTIELWNPGSVLPGVAGGLCLLLAFFTFQVLPRLHPGSCSFSSASGCSCSR